MFEWMNTKHLLRRKISMRHQGTASSMTQVFENLTTSEYLGRSFLFGFILRSLIILLYPFTRHYLLSLKPNTNLTKDQPGRLPEAQEPHRPLGITLYPPTCLLLWSITWGFHFFCSLTLMTNVLLLTKKKWISPSSGGWL